MRHFRDRERGRIHKCQTKPVSLSSAMVGSKAYSIREEFYISSF